MGQYGRVSGGRRRGNAAWQWLIIGFFPGLLCGGVVIFALALTGVLQGLTAGPTPTPPPPQEVVLVVTATQDPNMPTNTPFVITSTAEPTTEVEDAVMVQASPTPQTAEETGGETATDTTADSTPDTNDTGAQVDTSILTPQNTAPTAAAAETPISTGVVVPPELANIISDTRRIEGGTFTLGTERTEVVTAAEQCLTRDGGQCDPSMGEDSYPPVQVQISTFDMEATEVTFSQYVAFLNYLRSQGSDHLDGCGGFICIQTLNERPQDSGGVIVFDGATYEVPTTLNDFPVYAVSWYGAKAYCETIGRRLPTEAEWEYAASGPSNFIYPWGNDFNSAYMKTRIPTDGPQGPVAVGTYANVGTANNLFDMAGNVEEWVSDWYQADYYVQLANQGTTPVDPQGPPTGVQKVLRGGSWNAMPFFSRTAHRRSYNPLPVDDNDAAFPRSIGFRCAADVSNTTPSGAVDPASLGVDVQTDTTVTDTPVDAAPTLPSAPEEESSSEETNSGSTSQRG